MRSSFARDAMGTRFTIVCWSADQAGAERAAQEAFARIVALERVASDWDAGSEVERAVRDRRAHVAEGVPISSELAAVLEVALAVAARTEGAFDPTCGAATRLWRRALRRGIAPTAEEARRVQLAGGFEQVRLLPGPCLRIVERPELRFDLGGIAKGAALDAALAVLAAAGIERALIEGGGDVVCGAAPPGSDGWRVRVEGGEPDSAVTLALVRAAVATSGDDVRRGVVAGEMRSHLYAPGDGMPLLATGRRASVVAATGAVADAWATAGCLLEPQEFARCFDAASRTGLIAYRLRDERARTWSSRSWKGLVSSADASPRARGTSE